MYDVLFVFVNPYKISSLNDQTLVITMGSIYSSEKFEAFKFDDSVPEENCSWNSALSKKKKSRRGYYGADNYSLLESLAGGMASRGKKLRNETLIVNEVDAVMNERINRSDAALQSSSSNYKSNTLSQSKFLDHLTSHKAATDRKDSDCNQRPHLADNELISIISDDDTDKLFTMSSNNDFEDADEQVLEQETTSHVKESSVVVYPESVTYGKNCYSDAQLTFFGSSIKLGVSEEGATGCLTFEWKTVNLVSIQSRWLDPFIAAEVCLFIKSEHRQKSGILEVKFTFNDPCWSDKQDLIKSINEQYTEKWDVDLDSCELFEDVTYIEGDGDSITISERDFQLLQPEKFINDTIVDFYIEYLKKIKSADARVHFFNSFFFRKLADFNENQSRSADSKEAFQRVRKWTKKVNIFHKDYIFIPVNFRLHWSLIIICHPGEVVNFRDDDMPISLKVPCILHMDSIKGSHRGLEQSIKCYLWEEWKERNNDTSEDISTKFMNLHFLRLEVPQQENSYDCGLFMLHYMEIFVKKASDNFNPLNNFINKDWFYPMEASLKRARIKRLIFELTKRNAQRFLSPKSSFELKDEDGEEEEADVQILNEAGNLKETCCESIFDTRVDKSKDVMPVVLRSEYMDTNLSDSDINGGSSIADNEQKNHGQMVLYDPSIVTTSTIKNNETEDFGDNQVEIVPEPNQINSTVTCINKSLNLLQLKDKSAEHIDVFESHIIEDSDDDDVFITCIVEDSGSDDDSEIGTNVETSKRKQRQPVVSVARKRPKRSS